jgi:hypothetical protein
MLMGTPFGAKSLGIVLLIGAIRFNKHLIKDILLLETSTIHVMDVAMLVIVMYG